MSAIVNGILGVLFIGGILTFVFGHIILAGKGVLSFLRKLDGHSASNSVDVTINQMYGDVRYDPSRADYSKHKP